MGLFDGSGDNGMGLMGMYANPQTAALLGMSQGLLSAAGPSRIPVSMGQAMGAGMQGMQQNAGNALQMQQQMLRMQAMQGLMGGGAPGGQQQSPAPSYSSLFGPNSTSPASMAPSGVGGAADGSSAAGAPAASGSIYGRSPQQLFQQGMLMNMAGIQGGGDLMRVAVEHDPTLARQMPTDIQKNAAAAYGYGTPEYQKAIQSQVTKEGYIAPVSARPGGALQMPDGSVRYTLPAPQAGGMWATNPDGSLILNQAGQPYQVGIGGASNIAGGMAFSKAAGEGGALPYSGLDAQGNPLPVTNRTAAATQGGVPLPLRNNNPGAVSPGGAVAQYPDLQTGLSAMDQNLATYANDPKVKTLGDAVTKWVGSPPNAPAYIKDVSARLGIPANTPIDLANPAQRQALGTAIMLHENGPGAVFKPSAGGSAAAGAAPAQPGGGQIYASAPMGASTFAQGQVQQMQKRWDQQRDQNGSAQTVISQLQNISSLAPSAITGAEADHRAYVNGLLSLVGVPGANDSKTSTDLLNKYSNQIIAKLGQGGLGTDAARSIVAAGNPNAHMSVDAIQEAVRNLSSQYQMTQAKTQLLMPYANGNDPAGYSKTEAAFDKNADPRVWEYMAIQDPVARQKFAAGVLKQDPKFGQKIHTLEQMGALQ
jgi:hypothetical protein